MPDYSWILTVLLFLPIVFFGLLSWWGWQYHRYLLEALNAGICGTPAPIFYRLYCNRWNTLLLFLLFLILFLLSFVL